MEVLDRGEVLHAVAVDVAGREHAREARDLRLQEGLLFGHGVGVVDHEQHVDVAVGLIAAVFAAAGGADEGAREMSRARDREAALDPRGARDVGVALAGGPEDGGSALIATEGHPQLDGGGEGQTLGLEADDGSERGEAARRRRLGDDHADLGRLAQRPAGDPQLQITYLQHPAFSTDERASAHARLGGIDSIEMRLTACRQQCGQREQRVSTGLHRDSFDRG